VLFCHADVRGASMNDNIISRRGLRASLFPRDLPTYSGHFHKPHVVPNTSITYIGSPYQVSLSEAGQAKRFLLLSRCKTNEQKGGRTWAEKSSVPVDVGRRYFRVGSTADAGAMLAAEQLRTGVCCLLTHAKIC
jgi:DNA repair exonuclease SbcCD nuclease subunit